MGFKFVMTSIFAGEGTSSERSISIEMDRKSASASAQNWIGLKYADQNELFAQSGGAGSEIVSQKYAFPFLEEMSQDLNRDDPPAPQNFPQFFKPWPSDKR